MAGEHRLFQGSHIMNVSRKPTYSVRLILLVIGLPALLVLAGLWQLSRTPDPSRENAKIEQFIQTLQQEIEAKKPYPAIVRDSKGKEYSAELVISDLRDRQAGLQTELPVVLRPLAVLDIVCGLLAACIGGFGLLAIRAMGRRALASRDELLSAFDSGRKALPWLLVGSGTALMLGMAFALAFELILYAFSASKSTAGIKLEIAGVIFVCCLIGATVKLMRGMFHASRKTFEHTPLTLMGRSTSEDEAPALWAFVREVAGKAGAGMPNQIVIGLDQCFFVTESQVALSSGKPVPPGRTLYLPLPYMAFMGRGEAAAVIGHELAHFHGEDTQYSLKFSPIYVSAVNHLRSVHELASTQGGGLDLAMKPQLMIGEFFLNAFHEAVQHWSRQRELAADAMGARVADGRSISLALLRIGVLAPRIDEVLAESWNKGGNERGGVLQQIIQHVSDKGLDDPREHLEDEQPHPTDSHPTTRQRLEALGVPADSSLFADARTTACSPLLQDLGLVSAADLGAQPHATAGQQVDQHANNDAASSLSRSLETEFSQAADDSRAKEVASLREIAAHGREVLPICDAHWRVTWLVLLGVGALALAVTSITKGGDWRAIVGLGAVGVLALVMGLRSWRKGKMPMATFTEQGFQFSNLAAPVPWTAVTDYSMFITSYNGIRTGAVLTIQLDKDFAVPAHQKFRKAKYIAKKHEVRVSALSFRDMSPQVLGKTFFTYWHGGMARARLAELGYSD
jgi:Zn-dependent protease with chaperone function